MFESAPLVFALALLVGVIAQAVGRHVLIPGIVVLLVAGIGLGPDGADVIRPHALGAARDGIIGFAVAVILFEGGMRLDVVNLRKQATMIRRLVLLGAVVTALGGTITCWAVMGWDIRLSALFGTLVMVTGPTVIGPLVRRIRLAPSLATILEAEGIFIDAIGAMIAIMALEIALSPSGERLGSAFVGAAERLGLGCAVGAAGGLALGGLLAVPRLVPRGMENILALAMAVTVYQASQAIVNDSGIPAAVAAGMVVGNMRLHRMSELVEFKEQLTVLLIGALFVLLSADVRLSDVFALGWRGAAVVAVLALVVRPIEVFVCSLRTGLDLKQKLYLGWIAPRGIVAAAVASLFAQRLGAAGIAGGTSLQALVFTVIALTVTVQGLSAGPLATALGLRRAANSGYVLLGANPIARYLARRFVAAGEQVELIDHDPDDTRAAEEAGLKVVHGNGLQARTLARARVDGRTHAIALTSDEGVNLLFAERVVGEFYGPRVLVAIDPSGIGVNPDMVQRRGAAILFGRPTDVGAWIARWRRKHVEVISCEYQRDDGALPAESAALPLIVSRDGQLRVVDETTKLERGDLVDVAIATDRREQVEHWLAESGLVPVASQLLAA